MTGVPRVAFLCTLLSVLVGTGCRTTGDYVQVESIAASPREAPREYVLQAGDVISIRVWNQDSITTRERIRPDGKVSLPFVNDVEAAGLTPNTLAANVQGRLKDFIVNPVVTVVLEEARPVVVSVIGEVSRPGSYTMEADAGVLHALAAAGGMTPFADRDGIFVIRQKPGSGGSQRIRFTYSNLTQEQGPAAAFRLRAGDVVVVE